MAKPRVFISSTYFDLKTIRADLERFIKDKGFEPVRHEKGQVPYGQNESLEVYCYKEIELCDIIISIVGGRYGSSSNEEPYSISQKELRVALDKSKQVYVFIETGVFSEYNFYMLNKDVSAAKYSFDKRIFAFIEEVSRLPLNNQICQFDTSLDITSYLQEQWAGLFKSMLSNVERESEINLIQDLKGSINLLNKIVTVLSEREQGNNSVIQEILLSGHPLFQDLKKIFNINYSIILYSIRQIDEFLTEKAFMAFETDDPEQDKYYKWRRWDDETVHRLSIVKSIFDDAGSVKFVRPEDWDDNNVIYRSVPRVKRRKASVPEGYNEKAIRQELDCAFPSDTNLDDVPF